MITRIFRGRVKPGKGAAFERHTREHGLPMLRSAPGMLSVHFGTPTERTPNEYVVVTVWRDLASLRGFAGDDWNQPKLSLTEAHLLDEATVHHYRNGDGESLGSASLTGNGSEEPEVVDLGRVRVDLARRTVEVDGHAVDLPPLEFSLLSELALRPEQPVSSEELMKLAWPDTAWPTTDDVRRAIYRLRRHIGDQARPRPLIRYRRGYGYVLEP